MINPKLYVEKFYRAGELQKTHYGIQSDIQGLSFGNTSILKELAETARERSREISEPVIYENFQGSQIVAVRDTEGLEVVLRTGLSLGELDSFAGFLSDEGVK